MAVERRKCVACGDGFLGTPRAQYCSTACRQKAHRHRAGRKRDADRNATRVTVTAPAAGGVRTAEAQAVLAALDAELEDNAEQLGLGEPLEWSAAEKTLLELIADTIDRRVDLLARYQAAEEDRMRLKLATELRLLETSLARLLKQIRTDLPAAPSRTSQKAAQAAYARWGRDGA